MNNTPHDEHLDAVTTATQALSAVQTELERLRNERDHAITQARVHGATWDQLQRATGMTRTACRKAVARTEP